MAEITTHMLVVVVSMDLFSRSGKLLGRAGRFGGGCVVGGLLGVLPCGTASRGSGDPAEGGWMCRVVGWLDVKEGWLLEANCGRLNDVVVASLVCGHLNCVR